MYLIILSSASIRFIRKIFFYLKSSKLPRYWKTQVKKYVKSLIILMSSTCLLYFLCLFTPSMRDNKLMSYWSDLVESGTMENTRYMFWAFNHCDFLRIQELRAMLSAIKIFTENNLNQKFFMWEYCILNLIL